MGGLWRPDDGGGHTRACRALQLVSDGLKSLLFGLCNGLGAQGTRPLCSPGFTRCCPPTCRVDRQKYQIQIPLPPKIDPSVTMMTVEEKPDVTYRWTAGGQGGRRCSVRSCACCGAEACRGGIGTAVRREPRATGGPALLRTRLPPSAPAFPMAATLGGAKSRSTA